MISLVEYSIFIIQRTSFHDFLEIVTDGSFMQYVEFNLTTIIINEYFTWQWVMGSRICKGILVMFVQGQLAGAVSARMDCWLLSSWNRQLSVDIRDSYVLMSKMGSSQYSL